MTTNHRAVQLRRLHEERPLVLPNAWDAGTARIIEAAGARAIATTSAGVSWAHGHGDGESLSRDEMLRALGYIVRAVDVPVTADIEGGYGERMPDDVATTVRALVELGVAGINIEDSPGRDGQPLLAPEQQAARIAAARSAGGDLVINARIDVYLFQVGAPETRFDATVERARHYLAAGADCIFVPGVIDAETIGALVRAIDGPLNVMAMPGAPSVAQLAALGVARVSVGPSIARAALATVQQAAREVLNEGTYKTSDVALPYSEIGALFSRRNA